MGGIDEREKFACIEVSEKVTSTCLTQPKVPGREEGGSKQSIVRTQLI